MDTLSSTLVDSKPVLSISKPVLSIVIARSIDLTLQRFTLQPAIHSPDAAMELHLFDRRPIVRSKAPAVKWFKEWFPDDFLVRLVLLAIVINSASLKERRTQVEARKGKKKNGCSSIPQPTPSRSGSKCLPPHPSSMKTQVEARKGKKATSTAEHVHALRLIQNLKIWSSNVQKARPDLLI
ncbi:hypothetical protein Scep_022922 [Stephania cephalantha]|uniref:Uncharacterized protein n=1 Tax=Stephania cephalantha TaxID=152367 RepID=A0AAP0HY87_9MAGN